MGGRCAGVRVSILLEAIKFNHDPGSATGDALNIRRNASTPVTVPEWRRGISVRPEDSPAAYAIAETRGRTLTIHAQFRSTTGRSEQLEVRAVDPTADPPGNGGCAGVIRRILSAIVRALTGNVLGNVKARAVTIPASGVSQFFSFQLEGVRLWDTGVGVRTTTWRWQFRPDSRAAWTDFATTEHRIYSLLAVPTAPWQQAPYTSSNRQLPWTQALDYACRWAVLKTGAVEAAGAVTAAIYDLGPSRLEYDCPGGGSTRYAYGGLDLTALLDRIAGGIGRGRYVNCSDCATFVSTFANLLGCDLTQCRMGYGFGLNPLLAIGSNTWQPACGWTGFSYHEVAWRGGCDNSARVYDACLMVDGDSDPTRPPHSALLPTDMVFGAPGTGQYRDRLATPAGRPTCQPQPGTCQRRAVY
jgi:hypothetical protein